MYNSKKFSNFRTFIIEEEETIPGSFSSNQFSIGDKSYPEITMEFPTVTKHGEVIRVKIQGANYCIYVNGGVTILIPRKIYHQKYNRLPRAKTKTHSGDMVTAVFYKHKGIEEKNYKLRSFHLDNLR